MCSQAESDTFKFSTLLFYMFSFRLDFTKLRVAGSMSQINICMICFFVIFSKYLGIYNLVDAGLSMSWMRPQQGEDAPHPPIERKNSKFERGNIISLHQLAGFKFELTLG